MKTTPLQFLFMNSIRLLVKKLHPILLCELGRFSKTVKLEFIKRTPCLAQSLKSELIGVVLLSILNILRRDGGILLPVTLENARPSATPGV
jgi:hypothetical protein